MSLIFDSYNYKYGDYGLNNGSIFDINISGSSSYSATWYGPIDRFGSIGVVSGFTNLSNIIKHPDLINLYPGIYSGYSYDNSLPSSSATTTVEILEREKLVLDVSLYDDSCLRDDSLFCTLRVNDFNHDVNNFIYNLYVNDSTTPSKVYNGSKGNELYDFTGLTANNKYNVEAYETDEIVYMYKNIVECVDGNVEIENGTDPINIVNNWDKVAPFSTTNLLLYDTSINYIPSGIDSNGNIDSTNPNNWFYTGSPLNSTVWYYNSGGYRNNYYLGVSGKTEFVNIGVMSSGQTMIEGMDIGPIITNEGTDISLPTLSATTILPGNLNPYAYRFYYNRDINKFLILYPAYVLPGGGDVGLQWHTFDPRKDQGSIGNPTSNYYSTSSNQWHVLPFSGTGSIKQYTTSGASNTVVLATDKLGDNANMIECSQNSYLPNGFISGCGYSTYKHELTLGSNDNLGGSADNDIIGVILAWFTDTSGLYGAVNAIHNITLTFTMQTNVSEYIDPIITITHNFGSDAYGFTGSTEKIYQVPYNTQITPFRTTSNYYQQGYFNVSITRTDKIEGSGNGELFKIELSNTMGDRLGIQSLATKNIGESNPYIPAYTIEFDLSDSSTWVNKNGLNPDQSFITTPLSTQSQPNALKKFYGPQKYGYITTSQPLTQFFDISFSGSQRSIRPTIQTLVASAKDNEIIPTIPYDLNCEYIETICSGDFGGTNNTTDLYIDVLDNTNNPSVTFDLTSSVISDPCPSVIPNICGCPCDVCDQSIRINIKKK